MLSTDQDTQTPDRAPDRAWRQEADALVAGLAHSMSNRVASLDALAQMAAEDGSDPELAAALAQEVERLGEIMRLLRLLPRGDGTAEPVFLPDVLTDMIALQRHNGHLRDVATEVEGDASAAALLVRRPALLHALLLLVDSAREDAVARARKRVLVAVGADLARVTIRIRGAGDTGRRPPELAVAPAPPVEVAAAARAILLDGGAVAADVEAMDDGYEVRLPTLKESRKRQREG